MVTGRKCICKRCDYEWESRVLNPKVCPFCKSHRWNEPWPTTREGDTT